MDKDTTSSFELINIPSNTILQIEQAPISSQIATFDGPAILAQLVQLLAISDSKQREDAVVQMQENFRDAFTIFSQNTHEEICKEFVEKYLNTLKNHDSLLPDICLSLYFNSSFLLFSGEQVETIIQKSCMHQKLEILSQRIQSFKIDNRKSIINKELNQRREQNALRANDRVTYFIDEVVRLVGYYASLNKVNDLKKLINNIQTWPIIPQRTIPADPNMDTTYQSANSNLASAVCITLAPYRDVSNHLAQTLYDNKNFMETISQQGLEHFLGASDEFCSILLQNDIWVRRLNIDNIYRIISRSKHFKSLQTLVESPALLKLNNHNLFQLYTFIFYYHLKNKSLMLNAFAKQLNAYFSKEPTPLLLHKFLSLFRQKATDDAIYESHFYPFIYEEVKLNELPCIFIKELLKVDAKFNEYCRSKASMLNRLDPSVVRELFIFVPEEIFYLVNSKATTPLKPELQEVLQYLVINSLLSFNINTIFMFAEYIKFESTLINHDEYLKALESHFPAANRALDKLLKMNDKPSSAIEQFWNENKTHMTLLLLGYELNHVALTFELATLFKKIGCEKSLDIKNFIFDKFCHRLCTNQCSEFFSESVTKVREHFNFEDLFAIYNVALAKIVAYFDENLDLISPTLLKIATSEKEPAKKIERLKQYETALELRLLEIPDCTTSHVILSKINDEIEKIETMQIILGKAQQRNLVVKTDSPNDKSNHVRTSPTSSDLVLFSQAQASASSSTTKPKISDNEQLPIKKNRPYPQNIIKITL